ncbi:MAG: hypothetical protein ACKO0Z_07470 [Betaproteobacteria bacterium]
MLEAPINPMKFTEENLKVAFNLSKKGLGTITNTAENVLLTLIEGTCKFFRWPSNPRQREMVRKALGLKT